MSLFSKQTDFLAIGDTVTDAFIHLTNAEVLDSMDHTRKELCVTFGDKVPYDFVKVIAGVGNSANAAVSAARLGLKSAIISDIGGDQYGREMLASYKANKVDARWVTTHKTMISNYHYVLWYGVERTILVKHQTYPYQFRLTKSEAPKWIYLSSLGENSLPYHGQIADYLKATPSVKLAFQPGTYQMKFGTTALKSLYERTEIFFCNREEAARILGKTERPENASAEEKQNEILEFSKALAALGPKIVCITDGMAGAYAYDTRSTNAGGNTGGVGELYFIGIYPHKPYERTGAGDAFSSTVTVALALGKSLPDALTWGPINSQSVVQYVGAQEGLLTREKLLDFLAKAPADYKVRKV
jgi:sugar/nucleoside kinase (ribokinase family)